MTVFDRRPGLRWTVPVTAGLLVVAGAALGPVVASADGGLPPKSAQELLVALQKPSATAISGTVAMDANLGLPALPMDTGDAGGPAALVSGESTLRVWSDGSGQSRLALIGDAAETDIITDGSGVWVWSSEEQTADHYPLPEQGDASAAAPTAGLPSTPQEAATMALAALDETTEVSTSGAAEVAGRSVYELILTPRTADTRVARVVVAIDAETSVPLRVQVFSTEIPGPAFEVGFTSVDFGTPDPSIFAFTPPPGATVTKHDAATAQGKGGDASLTDGTPPVVVGSGWTQVVVASLPPGQSEAAAQDSALAMLELLPRISGSWGSGRVLDGTLVSVLIADDGRIAMGAVSPKALAAALAGA